MQALPYLMAAGTAVGAVQGYSSAQYQAQVAENNAAIMAENARNERAAADQDMMDKDLEAKAQIGAMLSEMGASGLDTNSGSLLLKKNAAYNLATQDRNRLAVKRDVLFKNNAQQQQSFLNEAAAAKSAGTMGLLSSFLAVPTSYLSGASMVNKYNQAKLGLTNPSYY